MNLWAGIGIGVLALSVWSLAKLGKASGQIVTEVTGRIHSLDFQKIVFAIDATIKNPTQTGITISYPFIKILYKGSVIASSDLVNQKINIQPMSQTAIQGIKIPAMYLSMTDVATELIQKLQTKKGSISLQAEITTTVFTGVSNIPFSSIKDITL